MSEKHFKVVGLGEVLYDILPSGEKMLGGAPANFAYVASRLGNHGIIASRVGNDSDGNAIRENLENAGVDTAHVQTDMEHQTGTVKVSLENGQPDYEIIENVAWDFLRLTGDWRDLAANCDAVCFGTLAQRNQVSRTTIRDFAALTRTDRLRIFDVNLRQRYFSGEVLNELLKLANIVKLNDQELPMICEMLAVEGASEIEKVKNLREKFGFRMICLTRGANGSLLAAKDEISEHKGIKITVADTIGAGDAFTAALAHGILHGWVLNEINEFASEIGAFVASQTGAMPPFER